MNKPKPRVPLPEVVIGEPMALPESQPVRVTKEQYNAHLDNQIAVAAAEAASAADKECPVRREIHAQPAMSVPPEQSPEFLRGFFGGLLFAAGVCTNFPISVLVQHYLTHVMELIGAEIERSKTIKKAA